MLSDPDCVGCLRKKLDAIGVVVFFTAGDEWRIGSFQGDKPLSAAQVDFESLLAGSVPQALARYSEGLLSNDDKTLAEAAPGALFLLDGASVIACPVHFGDKVGVRLAWRDRHAPFRPEDLETLRCFGEC